MGRTRKDIFNCEVAALPSLILSDFFHLPNEINLLKSHLYNKLRDLWKKSVVLIVDRLCLGRNLLQAEILRIQNYFERYLWYIEKNANNNCGNSRGRKLLTFSQTV